MCLHDFWIQFVIIGVVVFYFVAPSLLKGKTFTNVTLPTQVKAFAHLLQISRESSTLWPNHFFIALLSFTHYRSIAICLVSYTFKEIMLISTSFWNGLLSTSIPTLSFEVYFSIHLWIKSCTLFLKVTKFLVECRKELCHL